MERAFVRKPVVVGALAAAFVAVSFPYANLVIRGSRPANTSLPFGVVVIALFLVAANPLLTLIHKRLPLNRGDLLLVMHLVIVAAAVPTWGMVGQLLPIMAGCRYYATPENRWEDTLARHVPEWIAPSDLDTCRQFYEGLDPGARVPWGDWAAPLAGWAVLIAAFYAATMGIMLLLRRPWADQERLIYPLMRLPLEMVDVGDGGRWPELLRRPTLWIGVGLALVPLVVNGLHFHIPSIPVIKLRETLGITLYDEKIFLPLWINFAVIGFAYVVSPDLGFSLCLFAVIAAVQTPIMRLWGISLGAKEIYSAGSPAVSYQTMGAMVMLVGASIYSARHHLRQMWRAAIGTAELPGAESEPTHPRTAVLLTASGLAVMAAWLVASGLPPLATAVFLATAFVNFIALTRATVQGGVPVTRAAMIPQSMAVNIAGVRSIGPRGMASLAYAFSWTADIRVIMMTFFAHGLKLWGEDKPRRRGLLPMTLLAMGIAAVGATWLVIHLAYAKGGTTLSAWLFTGSPMAAFRYAAGTLDSPPESGLGRMACLGAGAAIMGGLSFLHRTLLWWPLHPLGFAVAATQPVQDLWVSILIGWVLKVLTMRYGGYRLYQRATPVLLGLILGQAIGCAGWLIVDGLMGATGNLLVLY